MKKIIKKKVELKKKVVKKPAKVKQLKAVKQAETPKLYRVSLTILGKEICYEGNTLYEIFDLIKPDIIRGRTIIKVYKDNLKSETLLRPFELKRLLSSDNYRQLLNKRLISMLR